MDEALKLCCLNLANKWIDYSKFHPMGKKIPPERGVVWVMWLFFWDEASIFKFRKCINYGECHTRG